MSERAYVPGVSAPLTFGQSRKRELVSKLGPGIRHGLRTPTNPLGLYIPFSRESIADGEWAPPEPYIAPYLALNTDEQSRCILRPWDSSDTYVTAAGLVVGGIYAYVLDRDTFSQMEQDRLFDTEMVTFSACVTAGLQREIARVILSRFPDTSPDTIFRIIRASYPHTVGKLTRCDNDVAVAIENSVGAVVADHVTLPIIPSTLTPKVMPYRRRAVVTHVSLDIEDEARHLQPKARCGGEYMQYGGVPFPQLLWNRINSVVRRLPWVHESLRIDLANRKDLL